MVYTFANAFKASLYGNTQIRSEKDPFAMVNVTLERAYSVVNYGVQGAFKDSMIH